MIEIAIALFFVTFLLELTGRRFLSVIVIILGAVNYFIVLIYHLINGSLADSQIASSTLIYVCGIGWTLGIIVGALLRLLRSGQVQVALDRITPNPAALLSLIGFCLLGAGQLGYAFAMNNALIYADQTQGLLELHNKSMENAYQGVFWLALAGLWVFVFILRPSFKQRGILFSPDLFVPWKYMESFAWKDNRLIVYLNQISIWPWQLSLDVKPEQRELINQLLAQHLSDQQRQSSPPAQTSA